MLKYRWIEEVLGETWATIAGRLDSASEADYERATPCPGWSVKDVLSHLAGFELMIRGAPVPLYDRPWPSYVRNPIGEFNEAFVADLRTKSGREVLALFRDATARSLDALVSLSDGEWERVGWSPEGERPYHRFQETRIVDSWIHLNDIFDALSEPDRDHGRGEEVVVGRFLSTLPYVVAKRSGAREGTLVAVTVVGPRQRRVVVEYVGGRASFVEPERTSVALEVTTSSALFWRRAAGRVGVEEFLRADATEIRGDLVMGERLVSGLTTMI